MTYGYNHILITIPTHYVLGGSCERTSSGVGAKPRWGYFPSAGLGGWCGRMSTATGGGLQTTTNRSHGQQLTSRMTHTAKACAASTDHSEVRFSGGRAGVTNRMARPHQPSTNTKHLEGGKRISWNCCHLPVPAPYERGVESRWRGGARTAVEGSTYWISIAAVGIRCILSGRDGQSAMFARDGTHSDHTWHFVTIHIS